MTAPVESLAEVVEIKHAIVGTSQGRQGAGQTLPQDSVLCIECGWMRTSDYSAHLTAVLSDHMARVVADEQEAALMEAAEAWSTSPKYPPESVLCRAGSLAGFSRGCAAATLWLRDRAATYRTAPTGEGEA